MNCGRGRRFHGVKKKSRLQGKPCIAANSFFSLACSLRRHFFLNTRRISSNANDPTAAMPMLQKSIPVIEPQPRTLVAMTLPGTPPRMPRMIVRKRPLESSPGWRTLPRAPPMRPTIIQDKCPICRLNMELTSWRQLSFRKIYFKHSNRFG